MTALRVLSVVPRRWVIRFIFALRVREGRTNSFAIYMSSWAIPTVPAFH
uniref:Uncharacterized protein n=1 Tax=Rhizobium leguminosarum bv. trifolii TaxID=386 RepID=A0A1C9HZH5_RHILT|nr:hypothetical protein [Rhizobium leguminosarum bv. trifolii]